MVLSKGRRKNITSGISKKRTNALNFVNILFAENVGNKDLLKLWPFLFLLIHIYLSRALSHNGTDFQSWIKTQVDFLKFFFFFFFFFLRFSFQFILRVRKRESASGGGAEREREREREKERENPKQALHCHCRA